MSWEDDPPYEIPCPCGKGIVLVTRRSNDWGQEDEIRSLQCRECIKYDADVEAARSPFSAKASELTERARKEAIRRFLPGFLEELEGKTKKKIWETIHGAGRYPSLATFYNHVQCSGLEGYLKHHFADKFTRDFPEEYQTTQIREMLAEAASCTAAADRAASAVSRGAE